VHYEDALTPQNIPLGVLFENGEDQGQRGELLRLKVRSRRRLDWDLFY
jgi:hypothetical protein